MLVLVMPRGSCKILQGRRARMAACAPSHCIADHTRPHSGRAACLGPVTWADNGVTASSMQGRDAHGQAVDIGLLAHDDSAGPVMPGMRFMMDAYEAELKAPIRNLVTGMLCDCCICCPNQQSHCAPKHKS